MNPIELEVKLDAALRILEVSKYIHIQPNLLKQAQEVVRIALGGDEIASQIAGR